MEVRIDLELALLRARCLVWIEIATQQAQNLADYGTADPGGRGPQLFPITHPLNHLRGNL